VTFRYLLDATIVSDIVRNPRGRAALRVLAVGEATVATSIIVAAELRYGAAKRGSAKLTQQIEAVLGVLPILPLVPEVDRQYATIRAALERAGTPIGANDLWLAAHARELSLTLVTANLSDFKRVKKLSVANWLA
jgi:tRNA(fMet)-specific endonuclease VapC